MSKKQLSVPMTQQEILLGYGYLALQLFALPAFLNLGNALLPQPLTDSEFNFLFFALNFLATTVIFRKFLVKNGKVFLSNIAGCLWGSLRGFLAYWILNYATGSMIKLISPDYFNANDSAISIMAYQNINLMSFGTVLLAPVAEELLYRALIFRGFYNQKPILGYLVSTLAFAGLHVVRYIGLYSPLHLMLCLLQYVPAGICLGWAYAKTDCIFAPILMHIAINQIGILSTR